MRITDIFDDSDFDNTATHFIFGYYSNNLNWVTLDYNLKYDETFFDSPLVSGDTSIEFGKL